MYIIYCGDAADDDCVITDNDITGGNWMIGYNFGGGAVRTVDPTGDQWPHQVRAWQYAVVGGWESDPLLTVTGNINNN